jgi:lipoprotein-anchoring transpeptidase ErfK/SrfK
MRETKITRRQVLRLGVGGGILAAAPFVHVTTPVMAEEPAPTIETTRRPFGRAIQAAIAVRESPSNNAKLVRRLKWNEVIAVKGQTISNTSPTTYNKTWYQTDDGFVYSAFIQPADNVTNKPVESVGDKGLWGEISVPVTDARGAPGNGYIGYRFYYGCVFHIIGVRADKDGVPWYQTDGYTGNGLFVRAEHMRVIPPDEFTPLSPAVALEAKRIDVDVTHQIATAYENDKAVFTARVATGATFRKADGSVSNFRTIPGEHRIFLKSASQHMIGGTVGDTDYYDLPGIGWTSYFTTSGIAFHGTYWHNDYGKPRSHGCVNMLPEDAKWVFRWTMPAVPYDLLQVRTAARSDGTLVKVF